MLLAAVGIAVTQGAVCAARMEEGMEDAEI